MKHPERLFDSISGIDEAFLEEAETFNASNVKTIRRKRVVKYSAYGAAGVAVSAAAALAYWKLRSRRVA